MQWQSDQENISPALKPTVGYCLKRTDLLRPNDTKMLHCPDDPTSGTSVLPIWVATKNWRVALHFKIARPKQVAHYTATDKSQSVWAIGLVPEKLFFSAWGTILHLDLSNLARLKITCQHFCSSGPETAVLSHNSGCREKNPLTGPGNPRIRNTRPRTFSPYLPRERSVHSGGNACISMYAQ